jgi:hypothetical protein
MDPSFPEMLEWGWCSWPDSEEYSYFFLRVLTTAQGGAATISECISASKNIVPGDGESWFRAWNQLAERNRARADQALERRSLQAATSNWLRASNYYRTSELFLAAEDGRRRSAILNMRQCAQSYLRNSVPKGEILQIPLGKRTMEAYYLRANGTARQPVVVCVGSTDDFKEGLLCSIPRIASESGYSVLLVDVIGSGTGIRDTNVVDPVVVVEDVIGYWIDHLWTDPTWMVRDWPSMASDWAGPMQPDVPRATTVLLLQCVMAAYGTTASVCSWRDGLEKPAIRRSILG